jgi:hypothetical protein
LKLRRRSGATNMYGRYKSSDVPGQNSRAGGATLIGKFTLCNNIVDRIDFAFHLWLCNILHEPCDLRESVTKEELPMKCPECGSTHLRRSHYYSDDSLLSILFLSPIRCEHCQNRFFGRIFWQFGHWISEEKLAYQRHKMELVRTKAKVPCWEPKAFGTPPVFCSSCPYLRTDCRFFPV